MRRILALGILLAISFTLSAGAKAETLFEGAIVPGQKKSVPLTGLLSTDSYRLLASLESVPPGPDDSIRVTLVLPGSAPISKLLYAGDPDVSLVVRPKSDGAGRIELEAIDARGKTKAVPARFHWARLDVPETDRAAIETEPNDSWRESNPLTLGRDIYGSADDVDYLENLDEGRRGLDWFRFEVTDTKPVLVYFQLDLLDRDVSANLRVYSLDSKTNEAVPYLSGKDPMEIVHDRERERYSKHVSRVFSRGTYFVEVNANHPEYILRTRVLPVPPYDSAEQAVEAGMHYIINVGDAWFAQIPREGNIYVRSNNMHDTATRCTACHPSSFSTEANLVAHRNGYPIRSKSNFQYVMDRIANSVTPLYGEDGLYWQRFIAIPLQAQGKQGGILADYEREVLGKPSRAFERFAPFLKTAWETRTELPADEVNGVVPLDSKFGFAWRDWQVLSEMAARSGRSDYAKTAETVARILTSRDSDLRVETFQDRIHRLHAWNLIDKSKFANKIKRETGALLSRQNSDGGWYEMDSTPGASAVYTTGQLTYTLLRLGLSRDHPAIKKAIANLLSQQQDFGGWFQTTTNENFRTPMRETRYAVMALAEAFPVKDPSKPSRSGQGWANRDEGPAREPRTDTLVHTLDDLENLWDVPSTDQLRISRSILPLLDHAEPMIRAAAAASLGRVGGREAVEPLLKALDDRSKIVWRASAWSLRRLGNQGIGVGEIRKALESSDPRLRRGATRIFAYQFHGMDERLDLADRLIELVGDPDLWTRLQALKTLRQWFYRTGDSALQRRIIHVYLARMGVEEDPVIRMNLSQGLYIMLDENLGGGVSLQKNIRELPEAKRPAIMKARETLERGVLLGPVLAALESGSARQRQAVLDGFDGSFFKGRSYARQPEAMIDVGNDREFGFLYTVPSETLDRTFAALFSDRNLSPETRAKAIALSSFFKVPSRTANPVIQSALLDALADPNEAVRASARAIVGKDLALVGLDKDPGSVGRILATLKRGGDPDARASLLSALARNPNLSAHTELLATIRSILAEPNAFPSALPILKWPSLTESELLDALVRAWPRCSEVPQRVSVLDRLFDHAEIVDREEPAEPVVEILRAAATDRSATVRERTLDGITKLPKLWSGNVSTRLLLTALADDAPPLRKLGLSLSERKPGFWNRPDSLEFLAKLLVDPDAKVRAEALSVVEHQRLLALQPTLARRVKALFNDPALREQATKLLSSAKLAASTIEADVSLNRPALLNFAAFRRKINPLFYQAGDDGYSCSKCHANHTILRIAEADQKQGFTGDQLMINYNSLLKVVNLGEPESSLLLRKPRSPQGQGGPESTSPTGLTHVGGPRWESVDHPAYQAILQWIRDASKESSAKSAEYLLSSDSYSPGFEPARANDGNIDTVWRTEFIGAAPGYPHEMVVDLGMSRTIEGMLYVPRQDKDEGRVRDFEVRVSDDGKQWSSPIARGTWANDPSYKYVALPELKARYVQLCGLVEVNGQPFMSAAELVIDTTPSSP